MDPLPAQPQAIPLPVGNCLTRCSTKSLAALGSFLAIAVIGLLGLLFMVAPRNTTTNVYNGPVDTTTVKPVDNINITYTEDGKPRLGEVATKLISDFTEQLMLDQKTADEGGKPIDRYLIIPESMLDLNFRNRTQFAAAINITTKATQKPGKK